MPADPDGRSTGGKLSFNCFNHSTHLGLEPTLPAQVAAAGAAGYPLVGLDVPSLLAHEELGLPAEGVREEAAAAGVECFELVPLSLGRPPSRSTADLDTVARLARAVGARHVLVTVGSAPDPPIVEELRQATDRLGELGVDVSLEFMATSPLATLRDALDLIERADRPEVGVVVDAWHVCLSSESWDTFAALPADRIGFVQLCDAPSGALGADLEQGMHERCVPGEGVLPLEPFRRLLEAKRYDGVVSVEVLSALWRERPIGDFAVATHAAALAWESAIAATSQR